MKTFYTYLDALHQLYYFSLQQTVLIGPPIQCILYMWPQIIENRMESVLREIG